MADLTYKVVVDLETKGDLGSKLGSGFESKLGSIDTKIGSISSSMADFGMKAAEGFANAAARVADLTIGIAKIGAVAGVGAAAYGVVKLNNELEKTQISLAAIFNARGVGGSDFGNSMTLAADAMSAMRKDAAALPGETRDLVGIFKDISVPGFQAGAGIDQLRKLSAQTMAASAVTGLPFEQAGREMAMLLEGRAGAHNVLGMRLAGLGGEKAEAFNKMAAPERLKVLVGELSKYDDAIKAFQGSFEGLSTSLLDNIHKFGAQATGPLFDRVKDVLAQANKWFDDNADRISHFADVIGNRLADAFDFAIAKLKKLEPIFEKIGKYLETGDVGGDLAKIGVGVLGAKMAPGIVGGIGALTSAGGGLGSSIGGAVGGPAGAAMGKGIGEFGTFVDSIAAIGPIAIAAGGAIHILSDSTSAFHAKAVMHWDSIKLKMGDAFDKIGAAWEKLEPTAIRLADTFGAGLLVVLDQVASAVNGAASALGFLASRASAFMAMLNFGSGNPLAKAKDDRGGDFGKATMKLGKEFGTAMSKAGGGGGGGGTNIQKVEITVSSNQDPSRIARLTFDALSNLARHPRASKNAINWSSNRL